MKDIGVRVILKNGVSESIDPVSESGFRETEHEYFIDNGRCVYSYKKEDVSRIEFYELCPECKHEVEDDGWCSYDCPLRPEEL